MGGRTAGMRRRIDLTHQCMEDGWLLSAAASAVAVAVVRAVRHRYGGGGGGKHRGFGRDRLMRSVFSSAGFCKTITSKRNCKLIRMISQEVRIYDVVVVLYL